MLPLAWGSELLRESRTVDRFPMRNPSGEPVDRRAESADAKTSESMTRRGTFEQLDLMVNTTIEPSIAVSP